MEEGFSQIGSQCFQAGSNSHSCCLSLSSAGVVCASTPSLHDAFITVVGEARTQVFPCIGLNSLLAFLDSGG